ncbi:MAG: L,D-transpeptidase family protein [Rubellimicrobium sp.]|nr:L,D-transpeptidase family protein [Rubellimicrobium sp.]
MPSSPSLRRLILPGALALALALPMAPAQAQLSGFGLAVAESAATGGETLAAFYRGRDFAGLWTGSDAAAVARRNALLTVLADSRLHGLPAAPFDPAALVARMQAATGAGARGAMEVELTRLFLAYAHDIRSGILDPGAVYSLNKREPRPIDDAALLAGLEAAHNPLAFLRALAPQSPEYARLMAARVTLEEAIARGGWGAPVRADRLEPGAEGAQVVALRDRLVAMGYLAPSVTSGYDGAITAAVREFQTRHGLTADGVAGQGTIAEINIGPEDRLRSVIVAMERERWLGDARGARHIWVNLADFTARIVDDDRVTFETRSVIGAGSADRQSPEFSDEMEYMVLNPSWHVPRSIIVNEYLPQMQRNPGAAGHLRLVDSRGRVVDRSAVNFSQYSGRTFPFAMVQPPSAGNALGVVKFMFPNPWNIYLHDTPSRDLFQREVRAFSHGCIRLNDPRDFAYALLAAQTADPEGFFADTLRSGAETRVNLEVPVPVHLDYRTAFTDADGTLEFRRDVYGRDALVWEALRAAGVDLPEAAA